MNIIFSKEELALLFTHLIFMKKNIKKGFKKTYKDNWKDRFNEFLSVIEVLDDKIKDPEVDNDYYDVELSQGQFIMMHSFINFYVVGLNVKENNKDSLNYEAINVLAVLEDIQRKINILAVS